MKLSLITITFFISIICSRAQELSVVNQKKDLIKASVKAIFFEENKGQINDQNLNQRPDILFSGSTNGLVFHIRKNGISYQLLRMNSEDTKQVKPEIYRVDLNWKNFNPDFIIERGKAIAGKNSYLNGPKEFGPVKDVESFQEIWIRNLWEDIDVHLYGKNNVLEIDYLVKKGDDYNKIQFELNGADLSLNKTGELVIQTPFGDIIEGAPVVLQNDRHIESKWELDQNKVRFKITGEFDPSIDLLIDPPVRIWGTYYGGTCQSFETAYYSTTDVFGNVFFAGATTSAFNIATSGAFRQSLLGTPQIDFNACIIKFDPDGNRIWGTYYTPVNDFYFGDDEDQTCATSCSSDSYGNIYVSCFTGTTIYSSGSVNNVPVGMSTLAKFNSNGDFEWEYSCNGLIDNSCTTDLMGNVYLAGGTSVADLATPGSFQEERIGYDAFLIKFNNAGIVQWATYYGGAGSERATSCSTDPSGNVYLTGHTESSSSLSTPGLISQGNSFLVKFNSSGNRQWATMYSGMRAFYRLCAADHLGNVYLASASNQSFGIATPGSHQPSFSGGLSTDVFLVKFNSNGVREWGTYYGGENWEEPLSCTVDFLGNVYLSGLTASTTGISTPGTHQQSGGGLQNTEGFLVSFSPDGTRRWGTYYGGSNQDQINSCKVNNSGEIIISGKTNSANNIATPGAYRSDLYNCSWDGFVAKLFDCSIAVQDDIQKNVSCKNGTDGALSVLVHPDLSGYSFNWSPGNPIGDNTDHISDLSAGQWTCTTTFDNGCVATNNFIVTEPDSSLLASVLSQTDNSCFGTQDGSASVFVSGGTSAYSYDWSPDPSSGEGTAIINNLSAGTWNCLITDQNGCMVSQSFDISEPLEISASISSTPSNCNNASGTAWVSAIEQGVGPYSFAWSPSAGINDSLTGLIAGSYTCIITDANNCSIVKNILVANNSGLSVVKDTFSHISCYGEENGSASVLVTSGAGNYTYNWTPGNPTGDETPGISNLTAGEWTCYVTDNNNCVVSQTFNIIEPELLNTIGALHENVLCNLAAEGRAGVSVSGGNGSYTYDWSPGNPDGDGTSSAINLSAGLWLCTVTDLNGCSASQDFNISQPDALTISSVSQENISCFSLNDGQASVTVTGGTPNYSYDWSPGTPVGDGTSSVSNLSPGQWTCSVIDENGCAVTQVFTIQEPPLLVIAAGSQVDVTCYSGSDGKATVIVSGGSPYYSYNWVSGNSSGGIDSMSVNLSAGIWSCLVSDQNGCTVSKNFTIDQPDYLAIGAVINAVSCNSGANGYINASHYVGPNLTYTYDWLPGTPLGDGTLSVSNLTAGQWTLVATNNYGCVTSRTFTITEPSPLVSLTGLQTNIICNAGTNGSASVQVSGGVGAYNYNWTPGNPTGDGTANISNLTAGEWSCLITDTAGCSTTQDFTLTEPDLVTISLVSQTDISCQGLSDGELTIQANGGNPGYTYDWSPGNPAGNGTATITNLPPGEWFCLVTDTNGCNTSQNFVLTGPSNLIISPETQTDILCNSGADGQASVSVTGGTPDYSYNWTPDDPSGDGTPIVTDLSAGVWRCTVTDAHGCTSFWDFTITEPLTITSSIDEVQCGSFTMNGQTYSNSGVYSQTLISSFGCDSTLTLNLTLNPLPEIVVENLGNGNLLAAGGDGYQWINCETITPISGAVSSLYVASENIEYAVIVSLAGCTDTSDCILMNNAKLNENTKPFVQIFPNPVSSSVNIILQTESAQLELLDVQGKLIYSETLKKENDIDLSAYQSGVYFLKITCDNQPTVERIIKQ